MQLPVRFPDEAEKNFAQAQAFRRFTSTERFLQIVDLIASGARMMADSPRREESEKLRQAEETRWRRIHRELFARHGF